jgi:hypothetical protein
MYRAVRGSWRSATASRARASAAIGAAFGVFSAASKLLQSILWQNEHDFAEFLVGLIFVTPVFAGSGSVVPRHARAEDVHNT